LPPEHYERVWASRRRNGTDRHSDETRARLRETTARAIAEGRIATSSQVEDVVAQVLDGMGVGYRRQVGIRGAHGRWVCVLDFLLGDGRALEVNGTFWHSDPRVFPDGPQFPVQVRNAAAWVRKVAALEQVGIPLVCVWESDISEDAAKAVGVALAAV
jgi:G:T-mismatch repair DNA endonuclease (very short patch repair protein)